MKLCPECLKASTQRNPVYAMDYVPCCSRLVVSARPMKDRQEAMLAHIVKHGKVTREQVLERIKLTSN